MPNGLSSSSSKRSFSAFFFSLSLYLESWSVGRARNALSALLDLAPPTARVLYDDGSEADVPASAVAINARFVVRGGDRILVEEDTRSFTALGATSQQARVGFESQDLSALEAIAQVAHAAAAFAGGGRRTSQGRGGKQRQWRRGSR